MFYGISELYDDLNESVKTCPRDTMGMGTVRTTQSLCPKDNSKVYRDTDTVNKIWYLV